MSTSATRTRAITTHTLTVKTTSTVTVVYAGRVTLEPTVRNKSFQDGIRRPLGASKTTQTSEISTSTQQVSLTTTHPTASHFAKK
jgi:hypothetical protein